MPPAGSAAPTAPSAVLAARGVSVVLGGATILWEVSVAVGPGEVVALVGPNGAGKSTLLSALAGDAQLAAGLVEVSGRPLRTVPVTELARTRAVQLQEATVSFAFTAGEVVEMGRAPWRGTPAEETDDAVVAASMARADVVHLAHRRFPTLSGGEKARTSFARALAQTTPVLLLDEPTAALDIHHQEALLTQVRECADAGCAVVVVLHDLSLAGAYADRIVLLAGGRVVADGPPRQVLRSDLLTEVYAYPVEVIEHPDSPGPVVLPVRSRRRPSTTHETRETHGTYETHETHEETT